MSSKDKLVIGGLLIGGLCCWLLMCGGVGFLALVGVGVGASARQASKYAPVPGQMKLKAFQVQHPTAPTPVVAVCRLSIYYNYDYLGCTETHYSIDLQDGVREHGWVRKDLAAGQRLYELLKDGNPRQFVLEMAFVGPDGTPTKIGRDGISITKIVKEQ